MKKNNKVITIINIILNVLVLISLGLFNYNLVKLNIIPNKYLIIGNIILLILIIIFMLLSYKKKGNIFKIIISIIYIILIILMYFGIGYVNSTYKVLNKTQIKKYETIKYNVLVLEDSIYNKLSDLNDKKIAYMSDDYNEDIKSSLSKKINYDEITITEFSLLTDLLNSETGSDALVLQDDYYKFACETYETFEDDTKIIYTFEVKKKSFSKNKKISISDKDPFILYISGIDQYGEVTSVRGRSDVNILAIINPKTNKILLVNTPRDYYVQLRGTTGLKDKLTHAGVYGIEKSVGTMEDLYNIKIDYYLRVNFDTVIKLVDKIGGVDINSDRELKFGNIIVNKGWNHFDGKTALRYSRERHAYTEGDRHRGQNQQQVITAIIDKVSSSKTLINHYNDIMSTLEKSFQTDMPISTITSFVKYQLNNMPKWSVESISVTGSDSHNYTYSMGTNWNLYVMEPNINSLNTAKDKIKSIYNYSE